MTATVVQLHGTENVVSPRPVKVCSAKRTVDESVVLLIDDVTSELVVSVGGGVMIGAAIVVVVSEGYAVPL